MQAEDMMKNNLASTRELYLEAVKAESLQMKEQEIFFFLILFFFSCNSFMQRFIDFGFVTFVCSW